MKLFFFTCILFLHTFLVFSQVNDRLLPGKGKIYAVVVGISKYENLNEDAQLEYAANDAEVFADYLGSTAGGSVPAGHIKLLLNKDATYSNIYDALKWLLDSCQKNDLAYFYFSGHGDLENNTMSQEGYLVAYNSLPNNFAYNAVRIGYLNDLAKTLAARNDGKVILITDACHAASLIVDSTGTRLAADQLRRTLANEIRLTSCQKDQLSNEDIFWGGGRSVFSYYMVKGLMGEADKQHDNIITVKEITDYLDSTFAIDKKLASLPEQKPVIAGNINFHLGLVPKHLLTLTSPDSTRANNSRADSGFSLKPLAIPVLPYFFSLLDEEKIKKDYGSENVENVIDFGKLVVLPVAEIPFAVIRAVKNNLHKNDDEQIKKLETKLQTDKEEINKFNDQLVALINKRTQQIINLYLKADISELEKRQYYNNAANSYTVFLKMFELALKLSKPGNEFYHILELKYHYFSGVVMRLKLVNTNSRVPLIDSAITEQKTALSFELKEEPAAYIRNELGVLYSLKNEFATAKDYFNAATKIAPKWAIPWANLVALYTQTKEYDKGISASLKADSLQYNFMGTLNNAGSLYESMGNYLLAEEKYRRSIQQNPMHYYAFERLGYVYLNTTQYAIADSFFSIGSNMKKPFGSLGANGIPSLRVENLNNFFPNPVRQENMFGQQICLLKTAELDKNNLLCHLLLAGILSYSDPRQAETEYKKVISSDKDNSIAYHYLAILLYGQKRWQEAEINFKLAAAHYMDEGAMKKYFTSYAGQINTRSIDIDCVKSTFTAMKYPIVMDEYYLGSTYELWGKFAEAEKVYRGVIKKYPDQFAAYYMLTSLMENSGRFKDAETLLLLYKEHDAEEGIMRLNAFYQKMMDRFPSEPEWYLKAGNLLYAIMYENENMSAGNKSNNASIIQQLDIAQDQTALRAMAIPRAAPITDPLSKSFKYLLIADSLYAFADIAAIGDDIKLKIGHLYLWQNDIKNAIRYFKISIELYPGNADTRWQLINVYESTYNNSSALAQLDSLYNRKQLNSSSQLLMVKYFINAGRFKDAGDLLKEAKAIYVSEGSAISELNGRMQLLSKDPSKAIPYYTAYLASTPNDYSTMYNIARAYAQTGDKTQAFKWLNMALGKGFGFSWVLGIDPVWDKWKDSVQWKEQAGKLAKKDL